MIQVDQGQGCGIKIAVDVGTTIINGVTGRQKSIGKFLRPVVVDGAVFKRHVVLIVSQRVPFVFDFVQIPSKQIDLVAKVNLKLLCEIKSLPMPLTHRLG